VARSTATAQFYANLDGKRVADGITEIVAMDFGNYLSQFLIVFFYIFRFIDEASRGKIWIFIISSKLKLVISPAYFWLSDQIHQIQSVGCFRLCCALLKKSYAYENILR